MAGIDEEMLRSKFRGSLVGALVGDCLGSTYEGRPEVSMEGLQKYFDKHDEPYVEGPVKQYTDDTAMTKCITQSLIEKRGVDPLDLAKRFVAEYKRSPRRGYGANVVSVFDKLSTSQFKDPFEPAQEQFNGKGSYGNGAAMRIAPIALYYHHDKEKMIGMTEKVSRITHSHELGLNGAIFQALAIRRCLLMDPRNGKFDVHQFVEDTLDDVRILEKKDLLKFFFSDPPPEKTRKDTYENQMYLMQYLLKQTYNPSTIEVVSFMGNTVNALFSVPTALYAFLRAQGKIPWIGTDNPFRRTIQYAISLGGDTDTIASMAGAIAGAYYGQEIISESLQKHCEYLKETIESADDLFAAWGNKLGGSE